MWRRASAAQSSTARQGLVPVPHSHFRPANVPSSYISSPYRRLGFGSRTCSIYVLCADAGADVIDKEAADLQIKAYCVVVVELIPSWAGTPTLLASCPACQLAGAHCESVPATRHSPRITARRCGGGGGGVVVLGRGGRALPASTCVCGGASASC